MSLWLRRKDPDGRTYYIASGAWGFILLIPAILGFLIAAILPLVQSCRVWLRG
jgi:hypothetical protein